MTTLVFLWQNNPTLVWEEAGSKVTGRLDTWALPASSGHLPTRVLPGPRLPLCEQVGWGSASPPFVRESAVVHGKECLTLTPIPRQSQDLLWLYAILHFLEFYISGTLQDALFVCLAFCFQYNYLEIYPHVYQSFIPFHCRVVLHCMGLPPFVHPFIFRWLDILVVSGLGLLQIMLLRIFVSKIKSIWLS